MAVSPRHYYDSEEFICRYSCLRCPNGHLIRRLNMKTRIDVETLAQATTDGLTSLALVVARTTSKERTHELLTRYAEALRTDDGHQHGAALVSEMARVVGLVKD